MERKNYLWQWLFVLLAVLELTAELMGNETIILFVKPLLMPVLTIWLVRSTPGVRRFLRHTTQAGLLFATIGDILLMFTEGAYGDLFFLLGLGAFLTTHLCYLGGFLSEVQLKNGYLRQRPFWIVPFLIFLFGFLYWLWPNIPGGMQLPVAIYALVISAMTLSVVNTRERFERAVFFSLISGALLFMFSDSLIAVGKFGHGFPGSRVAIMLTYILGQWLIVRSVAEHLRRFPSKQLLKTDKNL
jgi:uncharacterized membrane protein YhhN